MSIKEDLVYDKHSGKLAGFVNLGEINSHLTQFEQSIEGEDSIQPVLAKSMIAFMVKGLFSDVRFPYACSIITGEQIFTPFWQAVYHLERIGFKVNVLVYVHINTCSLFIGILSVHVHVYRYLLQLSMEHQ